MRNVFLRLFGNSEQKKTLANMIENGTFPHAMILTGPIGSGKHLFAEEIASSLVCHNRKNAALPLPCGVCPACQKIKARQFPDLTYVAPEEGKTQITVEKIRALRADMVLAANDSDHKIYVVEGADTMNAAAQNALLISLEEPPKGVIILLLCEQLEKLLPTVRSRCQVLRTELFEPEQIDGFLTNERAAAKLKSENPERYAAVAGLSSVADVQDFVNVHAPKVGFLVFGDDRKVPESEDLFCLAEACNSSEIKPKILMIEGLQDFLLDGNVRLKEKFESLDYDYTYIDGPGGHGWAFWDKHIQYVLKWMLGKV
jgi:DNA polymerase III delta' subunit